MCFVLTAVCMAQAWAIVFVLKIGPVIGTIDARAGRGVHSGDLMAVPLVFAALVLFCHGALIAVQTPRLRPNHA